MKNMSTTLFAGLVIALIGGLLYFSFSGGENAPALTITASNGEAMALNLPQKPVLLTFWATTCPGCISKMPELSKLKKQFGDRVEVVAISMDYDPATQVDAFIQANPYPFNFIKDSDGALSKAFGSILLTPTTFLIAPNGNIVYRKIGDSSIEFLYKRIEQLSPQL